MVLLDSEGIDAVMGEGLDDNHIFTFIVLLASVLIDNSMGVATRYDLNGLEYLLTSTSDFREREISGGGWGGGWGVYKLCIFLRVLKKLVLVKYRHCISTVLTRIPKENFITDYIVMCSISSAMGV